MLPPFEALDVDEDSYEEDSDEELEIAVAEEEFEDCVLPRREDVWLPLVGMAVAVAGEDADTFWLERELLGETPLILEAVDDVRGREDTDKALDKVVGRDETVGEVMLVFSLTDSASLSEVDSAPCVVPAVGTGTTRVVLLEDP